MAANMSMWCALIQISELEQMAHFPALFKLKALAHLQQPPVQSGQIAPRIEYNKNI